jgi:hypothetical protein
MTTTPLKLSVVILSIFTIFHQIQKMGKNFEMENNMVVVYKGPELQLEYTPHISEREFGGPRGPQVGRNLDITAFEVEFHDYIFRSRRITVRELINNGINDDE